MRKEDLNQMHPSKYNEMDFDLDENDYGESIDSDDLLHQYINEFSAPLLTLEQEKDLIEKVKKKDKQAKEQFIESNLKLVVSIAKNYVCRGMEFLDLIQEGNIALIRAVERFDPTKDYKFSTYATAAIHRQLNRAIANYSRVVRIPISAREKMGKILKTEEQLGQKLGRTPTYEEIAKEVGISVKEVLHLYKSFETTLSLSTPITSFDDADDYTPLVDFISEDTNDSEDVAFKKKANSSLLEILKTCELSDREWDILMQRYGFYDGKPKTLRKLAEQYNLTYESIRRIEAKAIRILQKPNNKIKFEKYIENTYQAENKMIPDKSKTALEDMGKILHEKISFKPMEVPVINLEDKKSILQFFNGVDYRQLTELLGKTDAIIGAFKFGFINNNYYSDEAIANFFSVDLDVVLSSVNRIYAKYGNQESKMSGKVLKISANLTQ